MRQPLGRLKPPGMDCGRSLVASPIIRTGRWIVGLAPSSCANAATKVTVSRGEVKIRVKDSDMSRLSDVGFKSYSTLGMLRFVYRPKAAGPAPSLYVS